MSCFNTRRIARSLTVEVFGLFLIAAAAASAQAQEPTVQTVEQTRKNIQVLEGLPDSELMAVMNFFRSSVGAGGCDYCHIKNDNNVWEYEKDDKNKKQKTRQMVRMVLEINKNSFEGRPEVTCYTCHQGHEKPTAMFQFPATPSPAEPRLTGPFPTPQQLVDKYLEAIGGKENVEKAGSMALKGAWEDARGTSRPVEILGASQEKWLAAVTDETRGAITRVLDGNTGWVKNPEGVRDLSAEEITRLRALVFPYQPTKFSIPANRMRLAARQKVGDRDAWVLRAPGEGGRMQRFFFDVETGLLLRHVVLTQNMMGSFPDQTDFEDYRSQGGVMLPFVIRQYSVQSARNGTYRFSEIKIGAPVDASRFQKP